MSRLLAHDWPGNVRELENTIERAVIMARGGVIAADHVTFPGQETRRPVDVTQAMPMVRRWMHSSRTWNRGTCERRYGRPGATRRSRPV